MDAPLLVRAARREPVERTPVWFMRQAGRSLPEYREIREAAHALRDLRAAGALAEVTLQPVRRHDVDAAVMFADIMSPVLGMGVEVELVEGVGPVVREPIRSAADVERLARARPGGGVAPISSRRVRIVRARAGAGEGGHRLLRRAVHGRGLPHRGQAEPRVPAREGADVPEPETWHALMEKLADAFAAYVAGDRCGRART